MTNDCKMPAYGRRCLVLNQRRDQYPRTKGVSAAENQ